MFQRLLVFSLLTNTPTLFCSETEPAADKQLPLIILSNNTAEQIIPQQSPTTMQQPSVETEHEKTGEELIEEFIKKGEPIIILRD